MNHLNDLTIYLTEKCNFSCSYCYYDKDFNVSLDVGKIRKGLDLFFRQINKKREVYVTILGGEPFLEKDLLFDTIDLIRQKSKKNDVKANILLFTNGSILDKEDVERLVKKKVRIYLSMDGIKGSNDCYRKLRDSDNSAFDLIIKNLKKLPKKYIKNIYINMVIGPKNCRYFMDNISFLSKMGFRSIDISLMSYSHWPKESLNRLIKQLDRFYHYYISIFTENKGKAFKMYQLDELFHGGWDKMDRCNRLKIAPDGNFYFCDAFFSTPKKNRYKIGDVDSGFSIEKIEDIKKEAKDCISKIFPKTFLLHTQNKMIYCPYGVYYHSKLHNKDLKKSLKNFYLFSRIYSSLLMHLFSKLRENKKFIGFYKNFNSK